MCDKTTDVISPQYIRGFDRNKGFIAQVMILMTVAFFAAWVPGKYLTPAEKYCPEDKPDCERPDFLAFEFVCGSTFVYFAFMSIRSWHIRKTPMTDLPDNPVGRLYGYLEESEKICAVSVAFQLWDLLGTPFLPEFCSPIMLGHHVFAASVSYVALQYQYCHYYTTFFFALSEVSSVPLVVMSLAKYYPPTPGTVMETIGGIAPALFAITFTYYRVILWIKVTRQLWSDARYAISSGKAEQYRPGKTWALYFILLSSTLLTLLQLFWFSLIAVEILKAVGIDVPDLNPGFE